MCTETNPLVTFSPFLFLYLYFFKILRQYFEGAALDYLEDTRPAGFYAWRVSIILEVRDR